MSPSYWKRRREKLLSRSRKGVLARERIRLAQAEAAVLVGTVTFDGQAFGGRHEIKAFARGDEAKLLLEIDGLAHRPRSVRGLARMISRRLWRIT